MKNNRFIENLDIKLRIFKNTERKNLLQGTKTYLAAEAGSKQLILRRVIMKMVYKIAIKATIRNRKAKIIFNSVAK